jgi:hypothetical protein
MLQQVVLFRVAKNITVQGGAGHDVVNSGFALHDHTRFARH